MPMGKGRGTRNKSKNTEDTVKVPSLYISKLLHITFRNIIKMAQETNESEEGNI